MKPPFHKIYPFAISFLTLSLIFSSPSFAVPGSLPSVGLSSPDTMSQIGIAAAVHGTVQINSKGQVGKVVESGQPIYLGDEVSTSEEASLQILLLDETIFTIGPSSAITIDKFVYDPASHDGEVKARVVKGIFRFVTGKIGQKKPQQMEVALPAGTIGIRGTIVAGEVAGMKSTVLLLGPGEKNNTGHRQGSFILSNESGGKVFQETVSKTGFGSTIDGEGSAPTRPFQIPAIQLAQIANALGPVPPDTQAPQNGNQGGNQATGPQNGPGSGERVEGDRKAKSPTEQSGQATAVAGVSIQQSGLIGRLFQKLDTESNQAAQRILEEGGTLIADGPTSRNQLQLLAQKLGGGIQHFEKLNAPITGAYAGGGNHADFYLNIDFGSRTVGGGNSRVTGLVSPGTFDVAITATQPFGFGDNNASFTFPGLSVTGSCSASCDSANVVVVVDNRNGAIAQEAHMGINIIDGGIEKARADTVGSRVAGAS